MVSKQNLKCSYHTQNTHRHTLIIMRRSEEETFGSHRSVYDIDYGDGDVFTDIYLSPNSPHCIH